MKRLAKTVDPEAPDDILWDEPVTYTETIDQKLPLQEKHI